MNFVDIFFLLQKYGVHDLNPDYNSKNPNLTIIFFHGITYGIDDDWKQTWTTRSIDGKGECICWPQMWIPKDLNDNVKILSLSYDSNVVASVHNDVTEIGRNLIQSLVTNSRCDNFLIYGHLIFHYVFQLKIIDCILTSLNKLFIWRLLWYTPNLEYFGTFKSIEENMKWGFGVNSHVEMNC
jgi:hypothetical protein